MVVNVLCGYLLIFFFRLFVNHPFNSFTYISLILICHVLPIENKKCYFPVCRSNLKLHLSGDSEHHGKVDGVISRE